MKTNTFLATMLLAGILVSCTQQTSRDPSLADPANDGRLWYEKPFRLVQTNLREIDANTLDPEEYVSMIKDFKATAALFNVGGIVANYPSELTFEYVNPNLREDMVGRVLELLHKEGIAMMGRFDFSKLNEKYAFQNPDWLYKNVKGEYVNYNGQVHTCINGPYQQEYALKILAEVLDRYALDGVFFNMIGYPTSDYSNNYHGICQCNNCKKRFREFSGMTLPTVEDPKDPVFNKYQEFKRYTIDDQFTRVNELIKSKGKDIAVCTYTVEGVDIVRTESHSGMWRRQEWDYSGTENVKIHLNSWTNRTVANTTVHFVDYPARHAGEWPHLAGRRLIQNMIHGAPLDYYMIGRLENQEDRALMPVLKDIFHFHADNEGYFTDIHSLARVAVVRGPQDEFRGLIRILSENHIPFDILHPLCLEPAVETPKKLEDYDVLVLPDYRNLSDADVARIDKYVEHGGRVLATGFPSTQDKLGNPLEKIRLKSAGVEETYKLYPQEQGRYFRIFPEDKETLKTPSLEDIDIIYLYVDFMECSLKESAKGYLGLIPMAMYGPPEKCYYTEVTEIPGIIENTYGKGKFVLIPWQVGRHYEYKSHHAHSMIVQTALNDLLELAYDIKTDASPAVEISLLESDRRDYTLIGMNNLSGQVGTAYHQPISMYDLSIDLFMDEPVKNIQLLRSDRNPRITNSNGKTSFTVPVLNEYEVVIVEH
jgi:hypothetical protein